METPRKIIRRSIFTFLQNYLFFTASPSLLILPFSIAILLSQSVLPFEIIEFRLSSLFDSAGFPPNSPFFSFLSLKLSETLSSSVLTLPFAISFFLFAKSSIIHALSDQKTSFSSTLSLHSPLLITHLWNSLLMISANSAAFSLFFLAFNLVPSTPNSTFFLTIGGAVLYSVIVANALMISNLALIVSGMENSSGYLAILKACVLIKGKASTALILALPLNLCLAATEALFQYRVSRNRNPCNSLLVFEGLLIGYLYSILLVLDTIVGCMFYNNCKSFLGTEEELYYYRIEIAEEAKDLKFQEITM
ncbi:hypothetical protein GIB67_007287 [Kingdonia uniflora]|uniref:Transmembrane protein n=1 Tax=Kingdonia uniflora TaxID=39325 RepID=A0A7J7NX36_9MAGN|nr:hypothetical protein GIB67_007287 [Kingdonia uniflora]